MRLAARLFFCCALASSWAPIDARAAPPAPTSAVTSDIDRFWTAYDRIRPVADAQERMRLFQTLYLDSGSPGLKAFLEAKGCTAEKYVDLLGKYPRFWDSVRPRSLSAKARSLPLEPELEKFRALYTALRPAKIYFLVGCMTSSGTTRGDKVLIGTELAMGDAGVDLSELPEKTRSWLHGFFGSRPADGLVLLNIHEYVHTQQKGPGPNLLAQALYEGAADFVAELVTGKTPPLPYMSYGAAHLETIKQRFRQDMAGEDYGGWLYNSAGNSPFGVGDLGYYVGYAVCKAYYARAADKKQAVKTIIELDYTDDEAVRRFLDASGFYR